MRSTSLDFCAADKMRIGVMAKVPPEGALRCPFESAEEAPPPIFQFCPTVTAARVLGGRGGGRWGLACKGGQVGERWGGCSDYSDYDDDLGSGFVLGGLGFGADLQHDVWVRLNVGD